MGFEQQSAAQLCANRVASNELPARACLIVKKSVRCSEPGSSRGLQLQACTPSHGVYVLFQKDDKALLVVWSVDITAWAITHALWAMPGGAAQYNQLSQAINNRPFLSKVAMGAIFLSCTTQQWGKNKGMSVLLPFQWSQRKSFTLKLGILFASATCKITKDIHAQPAVPHTLKATIHLLKCRSLIRAGRNHW